MISPEGFNPEASKAIERAVDPKRKITEEERDALFDYAIGARLLTCYRGKRENYAQKEGAPMGYVKQAETFIPREGNLEANANVLWEYLDNTYLFLDMRHKMGTIRLTYYFPEERENDLGFRLVFLDTNQNVVYKNSKDSLNEMILGEYNTAKRMTSEFVDRTRSFPIPLWDMPSTR